MVVVKRKKLNLHLVIKGTNYEESSDGKIVQTYFRVFWDVVTGVDRETRRSTSERVLGRKRN